VKNVTINMIKNNASDEKRISEESAKFLEKITSKQQQFSAEIRGDADNIVLQADALLTKINEEPIKVQGSFTRLKTILERVESLHQSISAESDRASSIYSQAIQQIKSPDDTVELDIKKELTAVEGHLKDSKKSLNGANSERGILKEKTSAKTAIPKLRKKKKHRAPHIENDVEADIQPENIKNLLVRDQLVQQKQQEWTDKATELKSLPDALNNYKKLLKQEKELDKEFEENTKKIDNFTDLEKKIDDLHKNFGKPLPPEKKPNDIIGEITVLEAQAKVILDSLAMPTPKKDGSIQDRPEYKAIQERLAEQYKKIEDQKDDLQVRYNNFKPLVENLNVCTGILAQHHAFQKRIEDLKATKKEYENAKKRIEGHFEEIKALAPLGDIDEILKFNKKITEDVKSINGPSSGHYYVYANQLTGARVICNEIDEFLKQHNPLHEAFKSNIRGNFINNRIFLNYKKKL